MQRIYNLVEIKDLNVKKKAIIISKAKHSLQDTKNKMLQKFYCDKTYSSKNYYFYIINISA